MRVNDSDETSAKVAAVVKALAADAFAQHELTAIGDREWLCRRPGTGMYHFAVIARRGVLVVYGDIGEWVLRMSSDDPVGWAARAVRSPDYFFEKMKASDDGGQAFYVEDVKVWLREGAAQMDDAVGIEGNRYVNALAALEERQEEWDSIGRDSAMEVLSEHFDDIARLGVAPSARSLWLLEAMRWFTVRMAATAAVERDLPGAEG